MHPAVHAREQQLALAIEQQQQQQQQWWPAAASRPGEDVVSHLHEQRPARRRLVPQLLPRHPAPAMDLLQVLAWQAGSGTGGERGRGGVSCLTRPPRRGGLESTTPPPAR